MSLAVILNVWVALYGVKRERQSEEGTDYVLSDLFAFLVSLSIVPLFSLFPTQSKPSFDDAHRTFFQPKQRKGPNILQS
jgi:hypothetical protein